MANETFNLHNREGSADEQVGIDSAATPGYLGAASSDGVLRVSSDFSYADGGDYVTLGLASSAIPTLAGLNLTGELDITMSTALLIDLNPGFTGTGDVIDITPSAALDTVDAEWDGIHIGGENLDPSALGADIHGIHVDLSGISLTNNPHIDCIHAESPSILSGNHALHADGEIHVDLDATSAVAAEEYTAIDVILATAGSTGGDLHGIDIKRSGSGSIDIAALGTHEGIHVLHQEIGTFANADKIWEYDNDGPTWVDVTTGTVSIWDDKDDLLYVGHANTFSEIKFIFSVVATKNMHLKFYFSTGSSNYTEFFPADDTDGATQDGSVRYTAASLATWATDTVNGEASKYWIKIERTRTAGTSPTATSMQQLAPTQYSWDKLGAITSLSLSTGVLTATGTVTIPTALTGLIRADSGVLSVDTDVTDLVSAATTSLAGKSELADASEVNTGTDTGRTITPDALEGSNYGKKAFCIAVHEHDDAVTVADGKVAFTVPAEMDTMSLVDVVASVYSQGVTNTTDIQIRRRRAGSDVDMLGTKVTLSAEYFASDGVVEADNDDISEGDQIYIDVDAIHSGTAPNGLSVTCTFAVTTVGV
jgi:hypothetical protein